MNLVFDTDILSTFGKIRRLDLLRVLFPNARFFIPPSVYNELFKARDCGYDFVDYVMESGILEVIPLNKEELEFLRKIREERKSLGSGELEGISICKHRDCILVTNANVRTQNFIIYKLVLRKAISGIRSTAMNIYHISYTEKFVGERMAMLSFKGCNFDCIGCIREKNEYDIYAEDRRYIDWNFENILKELEELNPHRIYLGGYEPTLNPDLIDAVSRAMKHLYVVSYHPLYSEINEIRETPRKAKFIEILPD